MRYKFTVSYNGNNYAGFQSQKNGITIQDVIESALEHIFHKKERIIMASRTDAGVHAKGQVFHYDSDIEMDTYRLKGSVNALLPKDIHIINVKIVPQTFHARFSVKEKTYEYLINNGEYDVFLEGLAYQCAYKLDMEKIIKASKLFIGKHNFLSFNTTPCSEKQDQVRTIKEFKITRSKGIIKIKIVGDGFLKNMVRIIVGTLIEVGRGKKTIKDVEKMLKNPYKSKERFNIDANGLYLVKIKY